MESIKRSNPITAAMSELLHQSGNVTSECKAFQGTGLDF